jgi:acylphosphatase
MSDTQARVHLIISGMVQMVGFRYFVEKRARQYGLSGFTRNLPDGGVEIEAEGERGMLEELVKDCRVGPPASRVTDIKIAWKPYQAEFQQFVIEF